MALKYAAREASFKASDREGCECGVLAISSEEAPYSMANTNSCIKSPAFGAITWAPKIRSVFLSAKTLTNPGTFSIFALALEFADSGKVPTLYSIPFSFNYSSVNPT